MYSETTRKGEIACAKAELRALEKGYIISKPSIECRYDRLIDDGKKIYRVQIKYADGEPTHSTGAISVRLYKYSKNGPDKGRKSPSTYSSKEVDVVLVYLPKIDQLCWLPPKLFADKREITLRTEPSKQNQKKGIHFAEKYFW